MNPHLDGPSELARLRGVTEVLHFTTSQGLIGILASKVLLSRDRLMESEYLENIALLNTEDRARDADWTDYISMSISGINGHLLSRSRGWHAESWWAVLAFGVEVLDGDGIQFCVTNNAYPNANRQAGSDGFEAMFAPEVPWGYYGSVARRTSGMPQSQPTHIQAELLYPGELSLAHLHTIYVEDLEHVAEVRGLIAALNVGSGPDLSDVDVVYKPTVLRP